MRAPRVIFNLASALLRGPTGRAPAAAHMALSDDALALDAPDIAVLGGGFGGLYTALRLSSLDWGSGPKPRVTLIDRSDRFIFLPMLYELTTGAVADWEVSPLFDDLLQGSDVRFVRADVSSIDLESRFVEISQRPTSGGEPTTRQLAFDSCVVALGAEPAPVSVPGAERALPFYTLDDALAVRKELLRRWPSDPSDPPLRVAVVGGGYIGVELAANLVRWGARQGGTDGKGGKGGKGGQLALTLVHRADDILEASKEHNRQVATSELAAIGVDGTPRCAPNPSH